MLHNCSGHASGRATGIVMASGDIVELAVPIHEASCALRRAPPRAEEADHVAQLLCLRLRPRHGH
eukprot:11134713-Alexandrium_andersonii.AAC.1